MAKAVAKSASRALGLLIVKSKIHGGFQHNIFSKLYDTMVCLVSYKLWILHLRNSRLLVHYCCPKQGYEIFHGSW